MKIFTAVMCILVGPTAGFCGAWTQPAGTVRFSPSVNYYSAQRQYSPTGSTTYLYYLGAFRMTVVTVYGEWGATPDLKVIGDFPFANYQFEARDSAHDYTRSLTAPSYFGAGVRYALWRPGRSIISLTGMLHLPPGFHHGLYDDPSHPFLSDGFLEGIAGVEFGTTDRWGWYEVATLFHARGEEAVNQMELRGVLGFASQSRVRLKLTIDAIKTLGPIPEAPLDAEETTTAEDYLWLGGQLMFAVSDDITLAAGLGLRVLGAHTLELSGGGVSVMF